MNVWLPMGAPDPESNEVVVVANDGSTLDGVQAIAALEAELSMSTPNDSTDILDDVAREIERANDSLEPDNGKAIDDSTAETVADVLVADDNPDMRGLLRVLISRHFRVRTAKNGAHALRLVDQRKPDLIVSDVMMPEVDGTELCRRIRSNPDTAAIPIILVTSKAEEGMKLEGLECGANDYITKPFHPRELIARVSSLANASALRRELFQRNAELTSALHELRRTEALLVQSERLAAVGELAAGIAHEVNNPVNFALNAARAMSTVVESDAETADDLVEKDQEVVELAAIVAQGLERTQSLVADLKNLAITQSDKAAYMPVSIKRCLDSTLRLIGPTAREQGIVLRHSYDELPHIIGSEGALGQVVMNLVKNACEAIGPSGGWVDIRATSDGATIHIEVGDSGPGIPTEVQARLFDPFFTTKPAGEGTGLGLAICQQIAVDHGGRIEVVSAEGSGAIFRVSLPIAETRPGLEFG